MDKKRESIWRQGYTVRGRAYIYEGEGTRTKIWKQTNGFCTSTASRQPAMFQLLQGGLQEGQPGSGEHDFVLRGCFPWRLRRAAPGFRTNRECCATSIFGADTRTLASRERTCCARVGQPGTRGSSAPFRLFREPRNRIGHVIWNVSW